MATVSAGAVARVDDIRFRASHALLTSRAEFVPQGIRALLLQRPRRKTMSTAWAWARIFSLHTDDDELGAGLVLGEQVVPEAARM